MTNDSNRLSRYTFHFEASFRLSSAPGEGIILPPAGFILHGLLALPSTKYSSHESTIKCPTSRYICIVISSLKSA